MSDDNDDEQPIFRESSPLQAIESYRPPPNEFPEDSAEVSSDSASRSESPEYCLTPGRIQLFPGITANVNLSPADRPSSDPSRGSSSGRSSVTVDQMETASPEDRPEIDGNAHNLGTANALQHAAAAGLAETERKAERSNAIGDLCSNKRVDSAQEDVVQLAKPSLSKLQTEAGAYALAAEDRTIATSPTLRKHSRPIDETSENTIPPVQPTPSGPDGTAGSPSKEPLPSFRQFTNQITNQIGPLNELAEAAFTQPYSHHHKQSFGSNTSQSPTIPYHTNQYPASAQTSPVSYHPYTVRSPTSTIGESQHYGSPSQRPTSAYYADRRPSVATDAAPPFPAPLPSASSSSESHGHTSSSTDGYPSSHTTPVEHPPNGDVAPRPILPPPPGMPPSAVVLNTGYKCNYPGCRAFPFQTQYLLSSHRNVHSHVRPYYCPEKDCHRSEGGKGFKRKNEMLRHGLVHSSPGYICPYCSDREHRYPRPDNLLRHVKGHHGDKDRDDPALREVLSHRIEGAGKQRRRRTTGSNAPA